jgi:hypothetical protein
LSFQDPTVQTKLEQILGTRDEMMLHAGVPFQYGAETGGAADVYLFPNHLEGIVYITGDLYGQQQPESDAGNYELMVCHKTTETWGPSLISKLAYYTLEASIYSGDTMDIGPFAQSENTIQGIIFDTYATFTIGPKKYGLLLILGITADELDWAMDNGGKQLIEKLKERDIYPITDLNRKSIFQR